jgi:hypothetical protein
MCIWVIQSTLGMALSRKVCMILGSTKKFIKRILQVVNTTGNDHNKSHQCIHSGSLYFISYGKLAIAYHCTNWLLSAKTEKQLSRWWDKGMVSISVPRPSSFQVAMQLLAPWQANVIKIIIDFITPDMRAYHNTENEEMY